MIAHALHKYDPVWKEIHNEATEFKRDLAGRGREKNKPTSRTIVMDYFDFEEDREAPVSHCRYDLYTKTIETKPVSYRYLK